MNALTTVILAWAAVYAYVCAYYLFVYRTRRSAREYLAFGLLSGGMAIYAVSSAVLTSAPDIQRAALAMKVGAVGLLVAIPFFVDFTAEVLSRRTRLAPIAYGWAALGLLGVVLGVFYEAGGPEARPLLHLPFVTRYPAVSVSVYAKVYLFLGNGIAAAASWELLRGAFESRSEAIQERHLRLLTLSACITVAAGAHDVAMRLGWIASTYLLEHTAMLFVFAMSYVLLDRFVQASAQLQDRTAELGEAYEALRRTQERLVRKQQLAAVGELSAVVAHEVRNPLAVIKNAVSGLRRQGVSEKDRATLLDILDEETSRLNRLMHDLLAYAQPVVPQGRSLQIAELVQRSVERARSGSPDNVSVVYELEGPDTVHGDPELLRHALVNVIENAIHAMAGEGCLVVRSKPASLGEHPAVALSFIDDGEGMDTLVRDRAKSPFFTTRSTGTGLGLAIVERVVRNHGGDVEIESRHGVGTTITFTLPVDRIDAASLPLPGAGPRRGARLSGIMEAP